MLGWWGVKHHVKSTFDPPEQGASSGWTAADPSYPPPTTTHHTGAKEPDWADGKWVQVMPFLKKGSGLLSLLGFW